MVKDIGNFYKHNQWKGPYLANNTTYVFPQHCIDEKKKEKKDMGE